LERSYLRIIAWFGLALSLSLLAAPNFLSLLSHALSDTFDSVFPAIPFAALLFVLFMLRGHDLLEIVTKEKGLSSELPTRLLGVAVIVSLLLLRGITGGSVELSGVAIILVFYCTSLILNPLTKRFMFSYSAIYVAGVSAPVIMQ
jgi:hypothetical protein